MTVYYFLSVLIVLILSGYWLFFKKFFSELGKQTAELATLAKRTTIVEDIKASLSRKNIAFQIHQTEYASLRFERLDQLYAHLYDLQKYAKTNLLSYGGDQGFNENRKSFMDRYWAAEDAYFLSLLYLDDDVAKSSLDLLNGCYSAFTAFISYYYSDQGRELFRQMAPSQSLLDKNIASMNKFNETIGRFPELLNRIRTVFRQILEEGDPDHAAAA